MNRRGFLASAPMAHSALPFVKAEKALEIFTYPQLTSVKAFVSYETNNPLTGVMKHQEEIDIPCHNGVFTIPARFAGSDISIYHIYKVDYDYRCDQ